MNHLVSSKELLRIIGNTLNHVDARLIAHGERVAYLVLQLLDEAGVQEPKTVREVCMLSLLHDIGAYKTDDIDQMVQFESNEVWQHSVYGYLFIKYLSPMEKLAPAILFHHSSYGKLAKQNAPLKHLSQLIQLADRVDTFAITYQALPSCERLVRHNKERFSKEMLGLYCSLLEKKPDLYQIIAGEQYSAELERRMEEAPMTQDEISAYLRMIVSSIDFRSPHTVTHTITTERISTALAARMGLEQELQYKVRCGAILHDLGKIAIPVEILEFPGKLSPQAMRVMRTHVDITREILDGLEDDEMLQIALRHHEKLDGSGYPRGLTGQELTRAERIVAVADIVSALSGRRSYKDAYSKTKIVTLLQSMKQRGEVCPDVVDTMIADYDGIMDEVAEGCAPLLSTYMSIQAQYEWLLKKVTGAQDEFLLVTEWLEEYNNSAPDLTYGGTR